MVRQFRIYETVSTTENEEQNPLECTVRELLGKSVVDAEAKDFGKVEDVRIDLRSGFVVAIVVRTGSRIFVEIRHMIIPAEICRIGDRVLLSVTKESVLTRKIH